MGRARLGEMISVLLLLLPYLIHHGKKLERMCAFAMRRLVRLPNNLLGIHFSPNYFHDDGSSERRAQAKAARQRIAKK